MLNNLHSKDRDRFIEVTPTAITKVSVPEMDTFSIEDAAIIENKMQMVLLLAMSGNNSNEVCLAYNVGNSDEFVTLYGSDNEIDFSCSSDMWNMVCVNNNENLNNVIVLHNHPTLNSFSVYDVLEFCKRPNIRLLGVATNLGKCYYLEKTDSTKISLWRAEFISEMNKGYRTDITREEVINLTISSIKKACMKCNGVKYYD